MKESWYKLYAAPQVKEPKMRYFQNQIGKDRLFEMLGIDVISEVFFVIPLVFCAGLCCAV